jgi:histidine triad (HIT) family protein
MTDCIFCNIIVGEIPSANIYQDEYTYAFLDINPNNHGHTLVIPKEHYKNLYDVPEDILCAMSKTAKKLAEAVKKGVSADGVNLAMNVERAAGQLVDHIHFHVIPRFNNDGYKHWGHKPYKDREMEDIAGKIKAHL